MKTTIRKGIRLENLDTYKALKNPVDIESTEYENVVRFKNHSWRMDILEDGSRIYSRIVYGGIKGRDRIVRQTKRFLKYVEYSDQN